jgi:phenylacetic acid degradation operon negative regulatory protein
MKSNNKKASKNIAYEEELIKQVFRTTANISLYAIYFFVKYIGHELLTGPPKSIYQAMRDSREFGATVSWKQFQRSFLYIKKRGDIKVLTREGVLQVDITQQGKERLFSLIPTYQKKRDWDKKLYIITYDIPVKYNPHRDSVRSAIFRLGGGKLQDSVYITPYNPRKSLREFIDEYKIKGDILVSDLGADGSIAGKSIQRIVSDVYKLDELNEQYKEYIRKYAYVKREESKRGKVKRFFAPKENVNLMKAELDFIRILQKDPQLPFTLLPHYWLGNKAYRLYQKITSL